MSSRFKKILSYVLKLGVSLLAIGYIIRSTGSSNLKEILFNARPELLTIGFLLYLISQLISTLRLGAFLRCVSVPVPFAENLRLYFTGMAYNLFLPGGIGGDAYKLVYFKNRYRSSGKDTFQALLLDRLFGLLAIVVLLSVSAIFVFEQWPVYWYILAIPLFIAVSFFGVKMIFRIFLPVYWKGMGYSLLVQLVQVLAAVCLSYSLGLDSPMAVSGIFLISSIATAVPVFLGGIGAREVVFGKMAVFLNLSEPDLVGTAILLSFITLLAAVPGLFLDWKRSKA